MQKNITCEIIVVLSFPSPSHLPPPSLSFTLSICLAPECGWKADSVKVREWVVFITVL